MITTHAEPDALRRKLDAFREGGGEGKPVFLQVALAWAPTREEAEALDQWGPNAIGGQVNWDLRRPSDFELATRFVRAEDMGQSVRISEDLGQHAAWIQAFVELGFAEIHLHDVGRDQRRFVETFGKRVLPRLDRRRVAAGSSRS